MKARLRKRYGYARLTKSQKENAASDIESAARDNVYDTEEVPRQDARNHGPRWHEAVVATLRSIRDSLQGREHTNYACPRALTSEEAHALVDPIIKKYTVD